MANENQEETWVDIKVGSEEDAFRLIEQSLNQEMGHQPYRVVFDKWPILTIKLEGDGYDSTITSDMAAALVELQHAINRSYARLVHDTANGRSLTAAERDALKFKAKVEKGSSLIEVNLGEWMEKLSLALVNKMSPEQMIFTVLGVAALGGSVLAYKAYLRHKSEDKKIDTAMQERIAMSQEETKRQAILARALTANPTLGFVQEDFDIARTEVLKGIGHANSVTVSGVSLDNGTATAVAKAKRAESRQMQLNGNYEIVQVNWQQEGEVRIKVIAEGTGRAFIATLVDQSIEGEQVALLKEAEWSRNKIYLSINATELRGEITTAFIVGVTQQPSYQVEMNPDEVSNIVIKGSRSTDKLPGKKDE